MNIKSIENSQTISIQERRQKRWQLVSYLRVHDADSQELIGHLVDISTDGIMLISEQPIPVESQFNFVMEVPSGKQGSITLAFKARSLWTKQDLNPHFHNSGFCLVNSDDTITTAINQLVGELEKLQEKTD